MPSHNSEEANVYQQRRGKLKRRNDGFSIWSIGFGVGETPRDLRSRVFGTAVSFSGLVGYFLPITLPSPLTTP